MQSAGFSDGPFSKEWLGKFCFSVWELGAVAWQWAFLDIPDNFAD